MANRRKAFLVGVGPGAPELVTTAARRAIQEAQIVLGWDLDLKPVEDCLNGKKVYLQDVNNYVRATRAAVRDAKKNNGVLAIPRVGEPCLSSGLKGLLRALQGFQVKIIPGISSIQLAAGLARVNIDESVPISFHTFGDPEEKKQFMLDCLNRGRHLIVLASPDLTPGAMADWLMKHGVSGKIRTVVGSFLTLPQEQVLDTQLARLRNRKFPWLSITVVVNPQVADLKEEHQQWRRWRRQQLHKKRSSL
ncbi:MAG TPA: cobalt-precorrin-7 (C(5))-methyltransferase [Terriglobales bacterium]|nr:cobalt-precorrin-7 (C(5))-methyltransferase [Terriglobales bacterium]